MKTMWIPLDCSALPPHSTPSSGLPVIQDNERCSLPWDAVTDEPFYSIGARKGGQGGKRVLYNFRGGGSPELLYYVIWGGEGAKKVTVFALYNM